jgi:DNA-directed RNA polymerase II subunit RPB2
MSNTTKKDENIDFTQKDIDILKDLYFKQPRVLFQHLFGSYYQLIDEIIPQSLDITNNYFYESVSNNAIYMHGFKCENISIKPPTNPLTNELMTPMEARKKHLKYFGTIVADVTQIVQKEDFLTGEKNISNVGETIEKVEIGKIPIMVRSQFCTTSIRKDLLDECRYDPGGYFIINGQEKVVVCIEKMVDNKILIFSKSDSSFENGYQYTAHINSRYDDWSDNLQIVNIKNKKDGGIYISIYNSQLIEIPIFILFRALGLETDKDIISNITYNLDDIKMINLLRDSIENSVDDKGNIIKTQEDAVNYLITKLRRNKRISQTDEELAIIQKRMYLEKVLTKDFFPHLGNDKSKNIRFLGLMINKLLNVMLGRRKVDDRDSFDNKRIETPGVLIGQLFRQNWRKLLNEIGRNFKSKNQSDENPIRVINQLKPDTIEQGIKTAMSTGIWGMQKTKKGVAQSMLRTSWLLVLSNLRKVVAPSLDASTTKVISIRHVNNLSYGFICPVQTPEGANIGIKKSLAMMATVTNQNMFQRDILNDLMKEFNDYHHPYDINPLEFNEWGKIFFNGDFVGMTKKLIELFNFLNKKKQENIIDIYTSICIDYEEKEIKVYYDSGRLIRPLLKVKNNNLLLTKDILKEASELLHDNDNPKGWKTLMSKYNDIISFEDIESSKYIMLAEDLTYLKQSRENKNRSIEVNSDVINRYGDYLYTNYTHCEFHRWTMLGELACGIPFANHNYGTKNIINFSQAKQGIGLYVTNYKDRMDISQVLYHPQTPLAITEGMKYNNMINLPNGENAIVAIMSYTGYNQEDSLIFNQAAIDRGIFRVDTLKKYFAEVEKNPSTSQDDIFTKPDRNKVTGMKNANYDKLDENGIVPEETIIHDGDAIIGKISPIQPTGDDNKVYIDNSEIFRSNVDGVIDRVHSGIYNNDGYEIRNVRVRMERMPIIGDKFASRHGQKGTLGIALPQKDMPFTESGMVPDLIMNPHAIPSRMTVAQLIECLTSKIGAIEGKFIDGTPFNNYDVKQVPEILEKLGYNKYGTEKMYCGITGKEIETQIFIGPTYYMRLKHMVLDKVHSRSKGPRQALTRQPLEGRSRGGGLRIGWMEKDSMIAHGIGQFMKERMMEDSDIATFHICDDCGMFVNKVMDKDYYNCEPCNNYTRISQVNLPYACKLLFQELTSINIIPQIRTKIDRFD